MEVQTDGQTDRQTILAEGDRKTEKGAGPICTDKLLTNYFLQTSSKLLPNFLNFFQTSSKLLPNFLNFLQTS